MRNFGRDEGVAPRTRLAGVGFKPPQAAVMVVSVEEKGPDASGEGREGER